jgi:hypothetical protein
MGVYFITFSQNMTPKGAISQKAYVLGPVKAYWMAFYNSVCSALQLAAALPEVNIVISNFVCVGFVVCLLNAISSQTKKTQCKLEF